jgi:alkanesulfonate monooxygenase SsuD/methylene tetrahydromethanopterin reductase-like flavin-dependent oxidoreductase (luciferase family)
MDIGVGLPNTLKGTTGALMLEWARRADTGPFASLGVFDRLRYDSYDPLIALAAAAGATTRIGLATLIISTPLRNDALLAKEVASLDALSGGRLTLGVALGARREDYEAAGVAYATRGRRLSEQLAILRAAWEEATPGPQPGQPGGPPVLVGGLNDSAYARAARYADGYVHGGGPPRAFAAAAAKARAAWADSGRPGRPLLWAQGYYALGEEEAEIGRAYMLDYYAFTGPFAERIAAGLLTTPQSIVQFVRGYAEAGCDHLVLFPTVARIEQLARLAEIVG